MILNHAAFYISNTDNKQVLINDLIGGKVFQSLKNLNGQLFSDLTLQKLITEELRHEHFEIIKGKKNSLQKYSEGEKKKLLLKWIIGQQPDYIIVDNVFDHLDVVAQKEIENRLKTLSKKVGIIQIANRRMDILDFIKSVYVNDGSSFVEENTIAINNDGQAFFVNKIPEPIENYPDFDNPLIAFRNVNVFYDGRPIVSKINWEINKGEFWQLMGPNGSGKSTLLSLINGHNPKAYGQDITLFGVKKGTGESIWDIRQKIGYFSSDLAQQYSRNDSVERMLISGFVDSIGLYIRPTDLQKERAEEWLEMLNMTSLRKTPYVKLSFGRQRLVLLVRAMVKHPPLIILDEPTVGLDDENVALFNELINKIAAETTTTIIFVSHRKEAGLNPNHIFELVPGDKGSIGQLIE